MDNQKQKEIWRQEKAQMRLDKLNQPREIQKREVSLTLGKQKSKSNNTKSKDFLPDNLLRRNLGI